MPEFGSLEQQASGAVHERGPVSSGVFQGPLRRRVWGSCLWLDVTGFTTLTEQMSEQGPTGIESLSIALDGLYARIGSAVAASGGQVLFFAGDGAMCLWTAESEQGSVGALLLAARTALHLSRGFETEVWHERLEVRQVVVSGELTLDTLGGAGDVMLEIVSGSPLNGLSELSKQCKRNQVLLAAASAERLSSIAELRPLTPDASLLQDLREVEEPWALQKSGDPGRASQPSPSRRTPDLISSELRRVSVAFVQWSHEVALEWRDLQDVSLALQHASADLSGFLCQLVRDEKGFTGLVAFGLPGQAQGDDSLRAVRFALEIERRAAVLGVRVKAGVATGPAFCGVCGSGAERQYCVLGNTVNRAARLTELAEDGPLVDGPTFAQAERRWSFTHQGRLRLRGLRQEVDVYRPGVSGRAPAGPRTLVGLERETAEVRQALLAFTRGEQPGLVIRGEQGAGKSALLSRLPGWCAELSLELCVGVADELDQHTGYFALRSVASALFADLLAQPPALLEQIAEAGESPELASLLNPLFLTDHPRSARVERMSPETRAENRERLVGELFRLRLAGRRLVIAIDDAHWLDASSLAMLEYLAKRLPNVSCIFATRPGTSNLSRGLPDAKYVDLDVLDTQAMTRLVLEHAAASSASPDLIEAVFRATRGNPLHCIELVRGFAASGRVQVRSGVLGFRDREASQLEIPGTLEELILARIDRLSFSARSFLRAASVMGVSFDLRVLRSVLAPTMSLHDLDLALGEIVGSRLVRAQDGYEFEHASLQSVVYGSVLPSDQRALHERTALALQDLYASGLEAVAARLAHHWLCAGNARSAAEFSAMAADLALQGYANVDAEHLFRQALEQDRAWRGELALDLRRARWSLSMAHALYSQSRHADARAAYERALAWTGVAEPGGALPLVLTILRATFGSIGRRAPAILQGEQRERRLAAIRVIHAWATLDIWEGRLPEAANKAIVAYRLAASVVDSPEAAEIISGLGYMLSTTPLRRRAFDHLQRALSLAETTSDAQARASTRVLLGMSLVLSGRTPEAEQPLREAVALAEGLGSGLWRHRAHFALAEWLLFAGELAPARSAFEQAASIAAAAEPPVEGFANCMAALALMRQGEIQLAHQIVTGPNGLRLLEAECLVLQRFTSLGISAEIAFRSGEHGKALELALRAFELSRTRRDVNVFFAALHGHAGTVFVLLGCLERMLASSQPALAGLNRRTLWHKANGALRRLRAFARMYPAAGACAESASARYHALRGRARAARVSWLRAAALARSAEQPYEQLLALRALAHSESELETANALAARLGVAPEPPLLTESARRES